VVRQFDSNTHVQLRHCECLPNQVTAYTHRGILIMILRLRTMPDIRALVLAT
jgi:hypothetical protein